ncbi:AAA family ATPase [Streptomyces violaceusniger]|uniref:AAA family ATPase n=1 Tax=Streptomyces violaceusniger TaxID=68280 RepID=UPI00342AC7A1
MHDRHALPFPDPSLVCLLGVSGSGKSRLAASLPPYTVLALDEFRGIVSGDPGIQDCTPEAVDLFHCALETRLARGTTTYIDATNAYPADRRALTVRAHQYGVPAIALRMTTELDECLQRNSQRKGTRRVPGPAILAQYEQLIAAQDTARLQAEGFAEVHDAVDLPFLGACLERLTAEPEPEADDVRTVFGDQLAAVFSWHTTPVDREHFTGAFAVGGDELVIRQNNGDAFDLRFEARVRCDAPGCTGPAWTYVASAADLLAAYQGDPYEELECDRCG